MSERRDFFARIRAAIPDPDIFEFILRLPLIEIHLRLFKYSIYSDTFNILNVRLRFWKWRFEFDLGETRAHRRERIARAKRYGQEYDDFNMKRNPEPTPGDIPWWGEP